MPIWDEFACTSIERDRQLVCQDEAANDLCLLFWRHARLRGVHILRDDEKLPKTPWIFRLERELEHPGVDSVERLCVRRNTVILQHEAAELTVRAGEETLHEEVAPGQGFTVLVEELTLDDPRFAFVDPHHIRGGDLVTRKNVGVRIRLAD